MSVLLTATMIIGTSNTVIFAEKFEGEEDIQSRITETGDVNIDPVELSLTLDKTSYDGGENIKSTLKIKNNNALPIKVSLTNTAPEGYEIEKADSVTSVPAGETKEVVIIYKDVDFIPTMVAKQKLDISSEFAEFENIKGYEADNKKIAKVNKKGIVKFKKTGTVTISAFQKNGKVKTYVNKKVVLNVEVPKAKKKVQLSAGSEANAINYFDGITKAKPTKWTSSKTSVATIDEKTGEIKAIGGGKTKITAFFGEGKNAAKYTVKINVPKEKAAKSSVSSKKTAAAGGSHVTAVSTEKTVTAEATAKADDANVTFKSSVKYSYGSSGSGEIGANFADTYVGLANLTASVKNVEVNIPTSVKFTATLMSQELQDSPVVNLVDDAGNVVKQMNDNGEEGGEGDDTAGDGIFTATASLNSGANGEKSYYAQFGDKRSNKETIFFYKKIATEEKSAVSTALSKTTADAVASYLNSDSTTFTNVNRVGNTVTFTTANGINGVWEPQPATALNGDEHTGKGALISDEVEEIRESANITADIEEPDKNSASFIDSTDSEIGITEYDSSKESKVLVVRPFHGSEFPYDDFEEQGQRLASETIQPKDDGAADLDVFKSFDDYGTVLLDSHGTSYGGNPYLLTGHTLDTNTFAYDADFQSGRIIVFNTGLVAVGQKFFDDYYPANSLKNTKLFLGTCYSSAADEQIPKKLVEKGASAVYGYDDVVSVAYCNDTLKVVVDSLTAGKSAKEAYDGAVKECRGEDPYVPGTDFLFEGSEATQGQIVGQVVVYDGSSNSTPIPGAVVSVWRGDTLVSREPVDQNGSFVVFAEPGTYDVVVSAYGYITDRRVNVEVSAGETTRLGDSVMLRPAGNTSTTICGVVDDAATAEPIADAIIRFRQGRDNTTGAYLRYASGDDVVLLTDSDGRYEFTELPYGYYTMEVNYAGYATSYRNIIAGDSDVEQSFSLSRALGEGAIRVVLWWGKTPYDIDSHMVGPTPGGSFFHTWYQQQYRMENGTVIADLDRDDTDSYGPETTTVRTAADGTYYFFVHNYSADQNDDPDQLAGSGAYAQVYKGSSLVATYRVPITGSGVYWNVFTYDSVNDKFTEIGTISDTASAGYGIRIYNDEDDLGYEYDDEKSIDSIYSKQGISGKKDENYLKRTVNEGRSFVPAK